MTADVEMQQIAPSTSTAVLSLTNPRLYAFALAISIAPLWLVEFLPMVDLPGHAAVIAALEELAAGNAVFTSEFAVKWYAPYFTAFAFLYALSSIVPITVAAKIVVSVSIVLTPIATGALLREAGADERWKWLAIPGSYSLAFYWGFLSYLVALPVGLWLLVQTVRFDRNPSWRGGLGIAALTLLAFFSHIIAMGLACLCALAYITGARYADLRGLAVRALPYTAPLPLIALWFLSTSQSVEGIEEAPFVYGRFLDRLSFLVSQPSGFDYVSRVGVLITLAILVLPALGGARLSPKPERWLPFAVSLAVFFATPSFAYLTGFIYERLGAFLVPLWLMTWNPPARRRLRVDWIAMLLVLAWVASNTWRFAAFAHDTRGFNTIIDRMEPGKRVAGLVLDNTSRQFATPVYLHFVSWYQAKKGGIVDFNFGEFQSILLRPNIRAPRVTEGLTWQPWLFDWNAHGGASYDYFVIRAGEDVSPLVFKDHLSSVEFVANQDGWWLYRNNDRFAR